MALKERFKEYVASQSLFSDGRKYLLAVSGGVDSMVLMHLFKECGYDFGVAHCNFQLRGRESEEDEQMVLREAERYGVAIYNKRFDTEREMELSGESMEMVARRQRYEWFEELCREYQYENIVVAHHADDSIETFFINLLRGTGLRGLTGIHVRNGRIIRPLMFASRKEILEYAVQNHIPYREDSSNRSTKYLRNKIRLGLVPRIKEINPKFVDLMRRNTSRLNDAQTFIDGAIEIVKRDIVTSQDGVDTIDLTRLDKRVPENFVLYEILNSSYGFKGDVVDSLYVAYREGNTGRRFYSPTHVAYVDRSSICVTPIPEEDSCEIEVESGALRSYCGNSVLYYEVRDIGTIKEFGVPENIAQLDADKLHFPLKLRRWRDGDWFVPFGMTGRKKISDFLIDNKVSMAEKERQFVLLSGDDIIWLVGRRIDDRYRLTRDSESVLRIIKEIL